MSFATAGMTRGVRTHMPVSTQAFQNLGEHEENKANSLATLQKLAAAREMPQFKREYSTASSHWSNSGLVDLNAHGDRLTAPCNALNTPYKYNTHAPYTSISRPYLPYDRRMDACDKMQSVVYVNNVEAPTNTDAKKIVQQYVSTLPSESKEHTDTKAGKNTTCTNMKRTGMPTSTSIENPKTDTGIANIEKKNAQYRQRRAKVEHEYCTDQQGFGHYDPKAAGYRQDVAADEGGTPDTAEQKPEIADRA